MSRTAVEVRRATGDDVDLLLRLAQRARFEDGLPDRAGPDPQRLRALAALERPDVWVLLACAGEEPVGALTLRFGELLPLTGSDAVHVEQLFVDPDWRRRGVARQLLAAAATTAENLGAGEMLCSTPAGARSANRFLARLGFAPFVVQRVVAVPALRRHLTGGSGEAAHGRHRAAVDRVLAQRRQARAKTSAAAAVTGPAGGAMLLEGRPAAGT